MRTTIIFLITLVLVIAQGWAAPVNVSQAQMVAQNFANSNGNFNASPSHGAMRLAHAEKSDKMKDQPVFYVFNSSDSYVIIAGDDRAEQVLGYGEGQFDINDIPCGMRDLFNVYKEEIEFLQTHPKYLVEKVPQGTPSLMATSVSPLLLTKWGQESPYYNQCPKYGTKRCVTGCVATAMAQIMYYWKYPNTAPSMSAYTTYSHSIYVPALSSKTLSWGSMKTSYSSGATGTAADAVAWLMRYVGQSVNMDYDPDGSGSNINNARSAFVNKFSYSSSATIKWKSNYTSSSWSTLLKTELNAGRPVYYRALDSNGTGGHAFVIDGYNTSGKFHINWGWNGSYSGSSHYFALDAFNVSGLKFNSDQGMIVNLRPKPSVSVSPSSVTFSNKTVGKTYTATITVTGHYLTNSLTAKYNGSAMFTAKVISNTINGATIVVTYKPTSSGSHQGSLTISGGGLTSNKTVTIKGNAKVRTITVTPTSLAFVKVKTGNTATKTFTVKGTNLTGPLTLSLSGANKGMFRINKTSITAAQAAVGVTVTVTYSPSAVGTHLATVTISGGDALESKTVSLRGTAIRNIGPVNELNALDKNPDVSVSVVSDGNSTTVVGGGTTTTTVVTGDKDNGTSLMAPRNSGTDVDELAMASKVYAEGLVIIIESPVEQEAIVSDLSGRAQRVNLQTGRNEIPVNTSGVYIVRIKDKSTKLMLR